MSLNSASPRKAYLTAVDACHSLEDWHALLTEWEWLLSPRVVAVQRGLDEAGFQEFRAGLQQERKKRFAGEAWARRFTDVLLPVRLMVCDEVASRFYVPWIVAWRRLEQTGTLPQ